MKRIKCVTVADGKSGFGTLSVRVWKERGGEGATTPAPSRALIVFLWSLVYSKARFEIKTFFARQSEGSGISLSLSARFMK